MARYAPSPDPRYPSLGDFLRCAPRDALDVDTILAAVAADSSALHWLTCRTDVTARELTLALAAVAQHYPRDYHALSAVDRFAQHGVTPPDDLLRLPLQWLLRLPRTDRKRWREAIARVVRHAVLAIDLSEDELCAVAEAVAHYWPFLAHVATHRNATSRVWHRILDHNAREKVVNALVQQPYVLGDASLRARLAPAAHPKHLARLLDATTADDLRPRFREVAARAPQAALVFLERWTHPAGGMLEATDLAALLDSAMPPDVRQRAAIALGRIGEAPAAPAPRARRGARRR